MTPPKHSRARHSRQSQATEDFIRAQRARADLIFGGFLVYEWILALAVAAWLARYGSGTASAVGASVATAAAAAIAGPTTRHHLIVAVLVGAVLAGVPAAMAWFWRGEALTRHTIAAAQLLFSGLLIYLTSGRIGIHFHICASLLVLLFYEDAWILLSAFGAAAFDQILRGWPAFVNSGFAPDSRWRTVEHAGWVAFAALLVVELRRESTRRIAAMGAVQDEMEESRFEVQRRARQQIAQQNELLDAVGRSVRAPMEGVLGMTSVLLDTVLTPTQERVTRGIQGYGEMTLSTVSDILDFSETNRGQIAVDPVPFNLQLAINQAADCLDHQIREKHLKLWVKYPANCPQHFIGDRSRIRQVMLNLLAHAARSSDYGGITVTVEALGTFSDETTVRVTVFDSGRGMAEPELLQVFEPFHGGDTGLRLALSHRLVSLMGGTMGAASKPGVGSQFWFTLRLKRDAPERLRSSEIADVRVMVVDYVPANRQILAEVLSQWGCRAESVSAALAMERLEEARMCGDPFRMLLTGHRMPEAEAEALGHAITADPRNAGVILVMAAAHATPESWQRSLHAGFTEYIEHPTIISSIYEGLVNAWRMGRNSSKGYSPSTAISPAATSSLINASIGSGSSPQASWTSGMVATPGVLERSVP